MKATLSSEEAIEYGLEPEEPGKASPFAIFKEPATRPLDRPLPSSTEAEKALLSSILLNPDCLKELSNITPDHFHTPAHATIFRCFREIKEIDLVTISQRLTDLRLLDQIGGAAYLAGLHTFLPTGLNFTEYAEIVRKKALLRRMISVAKEAERSLYEPGASIESILGNFEGKLRPIRDELLPRKGNDLTFRSISEILKMSFNDADLYLGNGYLQKGGSLAIMGSGGIGKSRLVTQLAICSAAGLPFLGWQTRGNPKWLFLQTENGNRRLHHDLSLMTKALDTEAIALLDKKIIFHTLENSHDVLMRPSSEKAHDRLANAIEHHDPDVVVFDVLRDFGIGDLNSDDGMSMTLDVIGKLARRGRPDRAIVIVHHARTGKAAAAGAFGLDRANFGRNSKVLLGWARAVLNIAPLSEDDPELIGIASGKNNDFREIEPMALRLKADHMCYVLDKSVDVSAKVAALNDTGKKISSLTVETVIEIVEASHPNGITKTALAGKVQEKGCGKSKAYDLISTAEAQKRIKFSGKKGRFVSAQKNHDFDVDEK